MQGARNAPRMDGIQLARATGWLAARWVKNTGVMEKATVPQTHRVVALLSQPPLLPRCAPLRRSSLQCPVPSAISAYSPRLSSSKSSGAVVWF